MRIAITMQSFEADAAQGAPAPNGESSADYFAEFQLEATEQAAADEAAETDDTVQVTVVLRGKREELENPALGMTNVILGALRSHRTSSTRAPSPDVIDAMGLGVETAY
jgi:hypothetical protein